MLRIALVPVQRMVKRCWTNGVRTMKLERLVMLLPLSCQILHHQRIPPNNAVLAKRNDSSSAFISAVVGGFEFACRIDSGADWNSLSDTIGKFLGDMGIFFPTRLLFKPQRLTAVDCHIVLSREKFQMSPSKGAMAGPC